MKRVVVTSSFASIINPGKGSWPDHTYTEADWNPVTEEEAVQNPQSGYRASKTFAERAAWDFIEQQNPNFTLATMCPPLVLGPIVHYLNSLDALNTSNQRLRDSIQGKYKDKYPPGGPYVWVDVRDLALLHVKAMEAESAANKRFFITAGHFNGNTLIEAIRTNFPKYKDELPGDGAEQNGGYPEEGVYKINNKRAEELLGQKWITLEKSVVDTVKSLQAVGA